MIATWEVIFRVFNLSSHYICNNAYSCIKFNIWFLLKYIQFGIKVVIYIHTSDFRRMSLESSGR